MNFLGIVQTVAHDAGIIGEGAAPLISLYNPALGAIVKGVSDKIVTVEALMPADGNGAVKQSTVANDFLSALPMFEQLLAAQGKTITVDQGLLKKAIDAQTAAFNAFAEFQKSFKITDTAPPAK